MSTTTPTPNAEPDRPRAVLTIKHSHAAGTVLHGAEPGDGTETIFATLGSGWRYSNRLGDGGAWYLARSRYRNADRPTIDRLVTHLLAAGRAVTVLIDNEPHPAAEVEADRADRAADRAARYTARADRHHDAGTARLDRTGAVRTTIPAGQPVVSDRYAAFLRRLNASEQIGYRDLAAGKHWTQRAAAVVATHRDRLNPRTTQRRITRLGGEIKRWQATLDGLRAHVGSNPDEQTLDDLNRRLDRIAELTAQRAHWQRHLVNLHTAGWWQPWLPEHFQPGDHVKIIGTWREVVRVNPATLSVVRPGTEESASGRRRIGTTPYTNVYGRRRDGNELRTPPPEHAICTEPESEGTPCVAVATVRLTREHGPHHCDCTPSCLNPDRPDRWREVRLYCPRHAPPATQLDPAVLVEHLR